MLSSESFGQNNMDPVAELTESLPIPLLGLEPRAGARRPLLQALPPLQGLSPPRLRGRLDRRGSGHQQKDRRRPVQELPRPRLEPIRGQVGPARRHEVQGKVRHCHTGRDSLQGT